MSGAIRLCRDAALHLATMTPDPYNTSALTFLDGDASPSQAGQPDFFLSVTQRLWGRILISGSHTPTAIPYRCFHEDPELDSG